MVSYFTPRFLQIETESSIECCDENSDGNNTGNTFSFPNASTASVKTTAESIPPLNPRIAFLKFNLLK